MNKMRWLKFVVLAIGLLAMVVIGLIYMQTPRPQAQKGIAAISVATIELQKRNFSTEGYGVDISTTTSSTVVIFMPPNREPGSAGNGTGKPGFEVELDADLKIISVSAIR